MTEQEEREWRQRLTNAVAETLAARVHKRQQRAEMGVRRNAGLQARHAAKLNRKEHPMAGETTITIVGNIVDEPELRFTPSGAALCKFRIASTPRTLDKATDTWKDGEPLFLGCTVWRQAAENVAESLPKGSRVIITGRLKQRSYEAKDGTQRTVIDLDVDEIGPSLKYATAKVAKMQRSKGGTSPNVTDAWATTAPAKTSNFDEEPPF